MIFPGENAYYFSASVSYPANIVLTLCGDWLEDHILAANAEENLLNLVQEFLGQKHRRKINNLHAVDFIQRQYVIRSTIS